MLRLHFTSEHLVCDASYWGRWSGASKSTPRKSARRPGVAAAGVPRRRESSGNAHAAAKHSEGFGALLRAHRHKRFMSARTNDATTEYRAQPHAALARCWLPWFMGAVTRSSEEWDVWHEDSRWDRSGRQKNFPSCSVFGRRNDPPTIRSFNHEGQRLSNVAIV